MRNISSKNVPADSPSSLLLIAIASWMKQPLTSSKVAFQHFLHLSSVHGSVSASRFPTQKE